MSLNVGDAIKDLSIYDSEKQLRKLSEWSGKRILIAFFPGAYTGVCDDELCTLDEFRDLEDLNVEILGITVDSPFVLKNWKKQTNTNITLLSDFNYELIEYFDSQFTGLGGLEDYQSANRSIFIIESDGVVSYRWDADSPSNLPDFDELKSKITG